MRTPLRSSAQTHRFIEVEWDHDQPATFIVSIEIEALDRSRLLRDIAQVLSENHVSIRSSSTQTSADRVARMRFDFEMADTGHLESVLKAIKRVDSVYDAYRLLPGHAPRPDAEGLKAHRAPAVACLRE